MQPQPNTLIEPQTPVLDPQDSAAANGSAESHFQPLEAEASVATETPQPTASVSPAADGGLEPLYTDQLYTNQVANSMVEETAESSGWYTGIWGAVVSVVLFGPVIGLYAWWLWAKSPFASWIKAVGTLLPLPLIYLLV